MKAVLFLLFAALLFACFARSSAEGIGNELFTNDNDTDANRIWRDWNFIFLPGTVMLRGIRVQRSGFNFERDVALFGATINHQTSFGYAYYDAEGSIATNPLGSSGSFSFSASRVGGLVRLVGLVEYLEVNGVPGFQPGQDTKLSNVSLTPTTATGLDIYNPVTRGNVTLNDTNGDSYTIHWLDATTQDGVLAVRLYASTKPVFVDGRSLTPDRIKLTFEVDYWNPLNLVASNNTNARLALVTVAATASSQSYRNFTGTIDLTGEDGIDAAGDNVASGGYTWELLSRAHPRTDTSGLNIRSGAITTQFLRNVNGSSPFATYSGVVNGAFEATWTASLIIHDLNVTYGDKLSWDPNANLNINYQAATAPTTTSNAAHIQLGFVLVALFLVFAMLF